MLSEKEKIDLITRVSLDMNEVHDLDILLEKLLTYVRRIFNADAGSIYIKEGDDLKFTHTQNETLQSRLDPGKKLIYNTFSIPINNNSIAGYVAKNKETINISDVYQLNNTVPYAFDSGFDKISDYRSRSMLTVPLINPHGDVLGVMQIINAKDDQGDIFPFSLEDEPLIRHFASSAALAVDRAQMTRNILLRMISMAELRDPKETGPHVNRVGGYSVEIYEAWAKNKGLSTEEIDEQKDVLRMAAMLHDVGKVAISDTILKKPAKLTREEFEIMKGHTVLGAKLFSDIRSDFDEIALEVALNHHEKWDGTGYPGHIDPTTEKALKGYEDDGGMPKPKNGEEIPLFGRIVALADVFDALNSRRCYKDAWDDDQVLEEIRRSSGRHFDPEIVDAFFSCLEVLGSIANRYPDPEDSA
jgi:HD-GYP domain-containing protein (c-di-GMP phosphodiesterase class II)